MRGLGIGAGDDEDEEGVVEMGVEEEAEGPLSGGGGGVITGGGGGGGGARAGGGGLEPWAPMSPQLTGLTSPAYEPPPSLGGVPPVLL
jgi:hypothetical protein